MRPLPLSSFGAIMFKQLESLASLTIPKHPLPPLDLLIIYLLQLLHIRPTMRPLQRADITPPLPLWCVIHGFMSWLFHLFFEVLGNYDRLILQLYRLPPIYRLLLHIIRITYPLQHQPRIRLLHLRKPPIKAPLLKNRRLLRHHIRRLLIPYYFQFIF